MSHKSTFAAVLSMAMLLGTASSYAGETYRGGPKGSPAIFVTAPNPGPLAAATPSERAKAPGIINRHLYEGGPKTVTAHQR